LKAKTIVETMVAVKRSLTSSENFENAAKNVIEFDSSVRKD
jgi:hypothetical protein